jgi:hypothetical protein
MLRRTIVLDLSVALGASPSPLSPQASRALLSGSTACSGCLRSVTNSNCRPRCDCRLRLVVRYVSAMRPIRAAKYSQSMDIPLICLKRLPRPRCPPPRRILPEDRGRASPGPWPEQLDDQSVQANVSFVDWWTERIDKLDLGDRLYHSGVDPRSADHDQDQSSLYQVYDGSRPFLTFHF